MVLFAYESERGRKGRFPKSHRIGKAAEAKAENLRALMEAAKEYGV
jgi:hypothetical protein